MHTIPGLNEGWDCQNGKDGDGARPQRPVPTDHVIHEPAHEVHPEVVPPPVSFMSAPVPFTGSVDHCRRALPKRFCVEPDVKIQSVPIDLHRPAPPRPSRRRRPPEVPLYESLAAEWAEFGRMVPGDHDREWVELVTRNIW